MCVCACYVWVGLVLASVKNAAQFNIGTDNDLSSFRSQRNDGKNGVRSLLSGDESVTHSNLSLVCPYTKYTKFAASKSLDGPDGGGVHQRVKLLIRFRQSRFLFVQIIFIAHDRLAQYIFSRVWRRLDVPAIVWFGTGSTTLDGFSHAINFLLRFRTQLHFSSFTGK